MISNDDNPVVAGTNCFAPNCLKARSGAKPIIHHGPKGVSRIDSRIGIAMEVETSMQPSTVVGLDLGEMKSTIPLFLVVATCSG